MVRFIIVLGLVAILTGCAARNPRVFARRDPAHEVTLTNSIALAARQQPRPEEAALDAALRSQLISRGFRLTAAAGADFVLASWVEENWISVRPAGGFTPGDIAAPVGIMTFDGSPVTAPGSLSVGISPDGRMERYLASQSIRLELYPQAKSGRPDLTPAWTGMIEGGIEVKPADVPRLLRAVLDHFGQDFNGRVKLGP